MKTKASAPPPFGTALDKIDARILRVLLQTDGRISNLKLAEAVHLSPTAVLERRRFVAGRYARYTLM